MIPPPPMSARDDDHDDADEPESDFDEKSRLSCREEIVNPAIMQAHNNDGEIANMTKMVNTELDGVSQPQNELLGYRPDIDGLRTVAVLSVFIHHADKTLLPGGFVAVDMFFVISGYVVTSSMLHRKSSSRSAWFMSFYARRAKRLGPTLAVVIFCLY